MDFIVKL